jgi:hypothetical protein
LVNYLTLISIETLAHHEYTSEQYQVGAVCISEESGLGPDE